MTIHSLLVAALVVLNIVCIVAVIFFERKNPASSIAWVLVLLMLPVAGILIYAMFGSGFHVNKRKRYALKRVSDNIYKHLITTHIDGGGSLCREHSGPYCRLIRYLERDGEHYYTGDNAVGLFTDGKELFASLMADIRAAKHHVHLLYYIFKNDELGREMAALLTEKARSGVSVRVIYDSLGSFLAGGKLFRELREAGGEVYSFSPVLFSLSSHLRLNYRNHRKIAVIDGTVGYVGGMNIGDDYVGRNPHLSPWRDTHLRLSGTAASFLQERFIMDWISLEETEADDVDLPACLPSADSGHSLGVQIVSSGPDTAVNALKNGLLEILYSARKNIYIQTPYFAPDKSFFEALRIAASSGVDVRLMLPGLRENFVVNAATYGYAREVLAAGVRVFRYKGFLHAKTIVADGGVASIGTANLDYRSFELNFEVNAFVYDGGFAARCEEAFLHDLENCEELTESWFLQQSLFTRASYNACRLFAPLI